MKKIIRESCFETNSSSCHSVAIKPKQELSYSQIAVNDDKEIVVELDEYGWNGPRLIDFDDKLPYALAMVLNTEYPKFHRYEREFTIDQEELEKTNGYQMILSEIREHVDCDRIRIKKSRNSYYPYGYIDHQSTEGYNSLQDFLDDWGITIGRFLFDNNVCVIIDNDNH
jgi:hypothetical protein